MSHQTSVWSPSVVVLFCLAASSLTSSAHVSLVFLIVSPNPPTRWDTPLILTSQVSLSSCKPLLAAIYQSQVNPDTRLHPPPPFVFTTVSCSFAHMYSVLLRLTFIPLLSRGYLHLSMLSSICCDSSSTPQSPPSTFLTHTFLSFFL